MSDESNRNFWVTDYSGQRMRMVPGDLYPRVVAMLRRLELGTNNVCVICGGPHPEEGQDIEDYGVGHSPACDLAALLRELP